MVEVIAVLCLALGAWTSWRRNPMYSARSTLRILLVAAASITASILLIYGAVTISAGRSPAFEFATMGIVIVFATLAMIFILQVVSTPGQSRPSALPPHTKLLTSNRRKLIRAAKIFATIVAAMLLPGVVIQSPVRVVFFVFAGFAAFLAIILLPVLYWSYREVDQSLTAVELDPWVHWKYPPEVWTAWSNRQVERLAATPPEFVMKRHWRRLALPGALAVVSILWFAPWTFWYRLAFIGVAGSAFMLLATWSAHDTQRAARKLRAQLKAAPAEAFFGRDGLSCDGVFTPWLSTGTYLISATTDERSPRSLLFRFERPMPNPYGGPQTIITQHAVLVPDASDADIHRLQQELTERCPKAKINLV